MPSARQLHACLDGSARWGLAPLILCLVLAAGCDREGREVRKTGPVPVTLGLAETRDVPVMQKAIGKVEALATVSIKSRITGQLLSVHFQEGQFVKQGDLLFTIDPAPFEAALKEVQAKAARDQALADKAAEDLRRYDELAAKKAVSAAQHEQFLTQARAQAAAAQASQAEVQNARLNLGYCYIKSPITGPTGGLLAYAGNMIKANDDKAMVVITQVQPIQVAFAVPEQHLAEIRRHGRAGPLQVRAQAPGEEQGPLNGRLVFIDNAVDSATGTIRLKASFDNQDHRLWPGQFVNVWLLLTTRPGVVVAPVKALATGQAGRYVFVVGPDQTAQVRQVEAGPTLDGIVVIEKGLQAGEKVVTDGQLRLMPGVKVVVREEKESGGGAAK